MGNTPVKAQSLRRVNVRLLRCVNLPLERKSAVGSSPRKRRRAGRAAASPDVKPSRWGKKTLKAKTKETPKSDFAGSGGAIKRGLRPQRKDAGAEAGRSGKALLTRPPLRGVGQQPGEWVGALPAELPGGGDATKKLETDFKVKRGGENDLRQTEAGKTHRLASKRGAERPRGRLRSERAPGLTACRRENRKFPRTVCRT